MSCDRFVRVNCRERKSWTDALIFMINAPIFFCEILRKLLFVQAHPSIRSVVCHHGLFPSFQRTRKMEMPTNEKALGVKSKCDLCVGLRTTKCCLLLEKMWTISHQFGHKNTGVAFSAGIHSPTSFLFFFCFSEITFQQQTSHRPIQICLVSEMQPPSCVRSEWKLENQPGVYLRLFISNCSVKQVWERTQCTSSCTTSRPRWWYWEPDVLLLARPLRRPPTSGTLSRCADTTEREDGAAGDGSSTKPTKPVALARVAPPTLRFPRLFPVQTIQGITLFGMSEQSCVWYMFACQRKKELEFNISLFSHGFFFSLTLFRCQENVSPV